MAVETNTILISVAILFAAGALIILPSSIFISADTRKSIWKHYLSEIIIIALFLLAYLIDSSLLKVVLLLFFFRIVYELGYLGCWQNNLISYSLLILIVLVFTRAMIDFAEHPQLMLIPVWIYMVTESNDAFAYIIGKSFGKHPIAPKLSPGKTWEGTLGGIFFALLAAFAFSFMLPHHLPLIVMTLLVIVSGLAGDYFISWLKRKNRQKDFKALFPQGGLLDIYDALIFSTVSIWLFLILLGI